MSISVIIVDDHQMLVDALAQHLAGEADIKVVGRYPTLRETLEALDTVEPDVVLLDYRLDDADGATSARLILDRHPEVAVLLMSASEGTAILAEALDTGVAGFIHKSQAAALVTSAVRAVAAGETVFEPKDLQGALRLMRARQQRSDLTPRELEILSLVAEGHTSRAIADHLVLSHHTVRNHVRNILEKLNAHSQLEAVAVAMRLGLIEPPSTGMAG